MKRKFRFLTIAIIIFLMIFYSNKMSITEYVCYGIVLALNFYDIIKDKS